VIICRKPFLIFDVDVVGAAAVLGGLVVAHCGMIQPALRQSDTYQALAASARQLEAGIDSAESRLEQASVELRDLRASAADRLAAAPTRSAPAEFVNDAGRLATEHDVQLIQILPQPARRLDGRVMTDVQVTSTASSLGFARFLDALHRVHPNFSLIELSIRAAGDHAGSSLQISWTVRLNSLAESPQSRGGRT